MYVLLHVLSFVSRIVDGVTDARGIMRSARLGSAEVHCWLPKDNYDNAVHWSEGECFISGCMCSVHFISGSRHCTVIRNQLPYYSGV